MSNDSESKPEQPATSPLPPAACSAAAVDEFVYVFMKSKTGQVIQGDFRISKLVAIAKFFVKSEQVIRKSEPPNADLTNAKP